MKTDALAIMLKAPASGDVKTRLVPPLTYHEAAELYRCFLDDIFENIRPDTYDVFASFTPESRIKDLAGIIPEGIPSFKQEGDTLGDRMYNVFRYLFEKGYKRVSIIGSDIPDMPTEFISESFNSLDGKTSLVLGPAKDGGYYLIGMDRLQKAPFDGIAWSTGTVLEDTLKNARRSGISYRLLGEWHDIDTVEDLLLLKGSKRARKSSDFIGKRAQLLFDSPDEKL